MTIIDVTSCNNARLSAAEWLVWAANHKVKDAMHHVLDVVWVDPATLGIYVDINTINENGYSDYLDEGDNPLLSAYTHEQWLQRFDNKITRSFLVPIQCILDRPIMHKLLSPPSDEVLDAFLEIPGLPKFDQVYREYERNRKYTAGLRKCAAKDDHDHHDHYEYDSDDHEYDSDHYENDDPLSAKIVKFLNGDPVYRLFIDRIKQTAYNKAVFTAMNAIVETYDYDQWLT